MTSPTASTPDGASKKTVYMTQHVNHAVYLFSSTNPGLPSEFPQITWEKINYLLNHKHGDRESIQKAIWYYTNHEDLTTDPDATTMVNDADAHATGFTPAIGDIIAIPILGVPLIQLTFLELTVPQPSTQGPTSPSHAHNHPPTADASAGEPYHGIINQPINFNATRSYDRDGRIISYTWTFGDGTTGDGIIVTHSYAIPGDYPVTLTVKDNWFSPDTYTTTAHITLTNTPPSEPPVTIDIRFVGSLGYLINTDGTGPYDAFYSNATKSQTAIQQINNDEYLIDANGDGSYDHLFNIKTGELRTYPETIGPAYLLLLIGVIMVILLIGILSLLMKRRKMPTKE